MNLVQLFKVNTDSSLSVISSYQDITFDCQADFRPGTVQFSLDNDSAISLGIKAGTLLRIKVDNNFIKEPFYVEARGSDFVSEDGVASKKFKGRSGHVIFEDDVVLPSAWPSSSPAGHSFQNATPGNMIKTLVLRAQERGTLAGVTTNSFNGTSDSNGAAWPSMMDRSFNAGDSILSVIQGLVDQGQVEAEMVGLDLRLYKPGTLGRSIPASEFVLRAAQNLAEGTSEEDSTEFATDIYAVGEGTAVTQKTRPAAYDVLGRRRVRFANYGGIADVPLLGVLADSELDMYTHIKREDSISIAHTILSPFQNYNVGDWVYLAREVSNPPEQVQIKQISVQVGNKGDISVGVSLGDLLDSADTKLKRRLDAITGTNAGGGAIPSDKGNDKNPPANVSNLTISKLAYVDDARARKMIAVVDWSDVTQNADGTPASDISYYEVRVKVGNAADYGPVTKATTSIAYYSGYAPGTTIQAQVRAIDDSGLASPSWTTSTVFTLSDPTPYTPPTASKPTVAASQQSLNITWDGKDSTGTFATPDVTGAVVHMSTTSATFTPGTSTNTGFIPFVPKNNTGGNLTLSGLEPSKTYYVRLVLVANSGNTGAAGVAGQATTGAYFVDPDVVTQVQQDMYDANGTVETIRTTLTGQVNAVDAKAQAAQSAANQAATDASNAAGLAGSKADVLIQSATPGTSFQKDTTLWIDTTGGSNTPKKWNGSAWIAVTDKAATDAAAAAVLAQSKADLAKQTADTAQTTANRKISVYTQSATPTAPTGGFSVGDVWFKTSDQNRPYTWNGSTWIDVRDQSIAAASSSAATALTNANNAMTAAQAAQAAADGAISTFYQETPPWADNSSQPSSKLGDLWYKTSTNQAYRWNGTTWALITDNQIAAALAAAQNAQTTADGKIDSFYQTAPPTVCAVGDLWFDTDDKNKPYYCTKASPSPTWTPISDGRIADAQAKADQAYADAGAAITKAQTAQSTADGKAVVYFQNTAPTGQNNTTDKNNMWVDTANGNRVSIWNGAAWVVAQDQGISTALTSAAAAQTTANKKITTYYLSSTPTAPAEGFALGDLWFNTGNQNELKRWSGSAWTSVRDGSIADAQAKADQAAISAGTAITNAQTAQSIADKKAVVYFQSTAPTGQNSTTDKNNMWVDTANGNMVKIWSGTAWVAAQDQGISTALTNAASAQTTANKKITTYYQTATPTAPSEGFAVGDLWFNTGNKNELKRWSGSAWVTARDGSIADAQNKANQAALDAGTAITNAQTAQSVADKKAVVYIQATAPTGQNNTTDKNNLWVDTSNGNVVKAWSGTAWVAYQDQSISTALTNAAAAQTTANKKITTYYLSTAPTAPSEGFSVGDLWINTGSNSQVNRWDGTRWVLTSIASTDYVASRGTDLVTNGTGLLGNNFNFSGFTYEPTDAPVGASCSFRSSTYMGTVATDELIPVDPAKKYVLTVKARQRVAGKASRAYVGLAPYDAQGFGIAPTMYVHDRRTEATLTAALNPGDTVLKLSTLNASYWSSIPSYKYVGFWNWADPAGRVWPIGTYTRNVATFSTYDAAAKTVTLSSAYAGPALPIGTPITRNFPGGNYMYTGPNNDIIPETWTTYQSALITGLYDGNQPGTANASTSFPAGCASVKIVFLPNRDVTGGEHAWAGISFSDVTAAQATADAAQVTASGKNTILWSLSDAPASAPGTKTGDIWNKYQIVNNKMSILRTWQSNGTSWIESQLTESYLPQVNIGTGTYGELDGIRLKARSVQANSVVVEGSVDNVLIADGAVNAAKVNAQSVAGAVGEFVQVKAENLQAGFITAGMAFSTGSFVAGQIFGKCAQMNANGFSTLQLAEDGTQYVSTMLGTPNGTDSLAVFNAPNKPPVFEVSSDGAVSAADLTVADDVTIAGRPLLGQLSDSDSDLGWLDDLPRGIIGRGSLRPLVSGKSVTNGFQDLGIMSFTVQPGRSYRITLPYAYVPTLSSGAQAQVSLIASYTLGTTATPQPADPTRSSGRLGQASKQVTLSTASYPVTDMLSFVFDAVNTVPVEMRILFSSFAGPNFTMGYSVADNTTWNAIIEDVGTSVPDTARLSTAPSISTYTTTWVAGDSRSYNGDGSVDTFGNGKTILRHGQYLTTNGNLRSAVIFPYNGVSGEAKTMATALSGATITKAEIYVESLHWATSTGGTARFFPMSGSTLPQTLASIPGSPVVKKFTARNQGFWLPVPTSWFSASNRGFIIGPAADATQANYGYFAAHNHAKTTARPKVRLTYTR